MRYCGHFLIKAEGGAKKYERDHPLLSLATLYRRFRAAKGIQQSTIKRGENKLKRTVK